MSFSFQEVGALRAIIQAVPNTDVVVIGAAALRTTGRFAWRTTSDLDLAIALEVDTYPGPISDVAGLEPDPKVKHRWWSNDLKLDILPAGPELRRKGHVTLEERRINLAGFALAFEHARPTKVDDVIVRIAPPPAVLVLKMVAYSDRPYEREKDLQDIAYLLEEYVDNHDDRRFGDRILGQVPWDHVSAHELGYDVGQMVTPLEERVVNDFFSRLHHPDTDGTLVHMLRSGPPRWRGDERVLLETCDAFEAGFKSGRALGVDGRP